MQSDEGIVDDTDGIDDVDGTDDAVNGVKEGSIALSESDGTAAPSDDAERTGNTSSTSDELKSSAAAVAAVVVIGDVVGSA